MNDVSTALDHYRVDAPEATRGRRERAAVDVECERFWRLWIERRDYLRKLCLKWLRGSQSDADEVLSVGAIKAIEYLRARPESVRNLSPWVSRILYNLCIDVLRERSRVVSVEGRALEQDCPRSVLVTVAETPERGVLRGELGRSIMTAVDKLPPKLYAVVILRFVEELPYREISARLAITPQNARKRIQQARQLLCEELRAHS